MYIVVSVFLFLAIAFLQWFLRGRFFYRTPSVKKLSNMANEKYILSPVDGIIVDLSLIREVKDFSSHKIKGLQCDKIDFSANIDSIVCGWLKISIYLSTFDRHSVYSPVVR